jgi:hypothetical protein
MRSFSAAEVLRLWERGAALHPIDRALLVLECAFPETSYDTLVTMPLGQRDRCLLEARWRNFGDRLNAYTQCPTCQERLEFSLSCGVLLAETEIAHQEKKTIAVDGTSFALRCPDSADAAAVAASASVDAGTEILLRRCVDCGENPTMLTPARRAAIAAALCALDPAAEILVNFSCPACGNGWQALFDAEKFLWTELCARARRLLQEVDTLARVYHWNETEILGMSEGRRSLYLEMALS